MRVWAAFTTSAAVMAAAALGASLDGVRTAPGGGQPPGEPGFDPAAVVAQVSAVRGLDAGGPITIAGALDAVEINGVDPDDLDERVAEDLAVTLGFFAAGEDQGEAYAAAGRADGTYDPTTGEVRLSADLPVAQRPLVVAHEVAHALADHAFDLERVNAVGALGGQLDRALAVKALIEGDATLTEERWAQRHAPDLFDKRPPFTVGAGADYADVTGAFPYTAGRAFVAALHAHGGWAAVDAAYADPPTTTEQVLHPERYLSRHLEGHPDGGEPRDVAGPRTPTGGWPRVGSDDFGEFELGELFLPVGAIRAAGIADGWDGGQVDRYRRSGRDGRGDEVAVALTLAFDDAGHAREACWAVPGWRMARGGVAHPEGAAVEGPDDWMAYTCDGEEVRVGLAPDAALAEALAEAP